MKAATGMRIAGVVALVCVIAGAAVAPASTSRHATHPRAGKIVARIEIPQGSGGLAVGEGAVWAMSDAVSTLLRIDPQRNAVIARIKVKPSKPCPEFPQACGCEQRRPERLADRSRVEPRRGDDPGGPRSRMLL